MLQRQLLLLVCAMALAVVAAACGGDDGGASAAEDGSTITVTALDNEFDPASISASADGTIELTNDGEAAHNFSIKGETVDVDVEPGASVDVELSGLGAGRYDVFCKFHEQAGMTASLQIDG
jgi:plastocyanin